MQISVELTLTPLQTNFEPPIIEFIDGLRDSGLQMLENPLSTQVYGEYHEVMNVLTQLTEKTFIDLDHVVLQMKIVKSNRSQYKPHV